MDSELQALHHSPLDSLTVSSPSCALSSRPLASQDQLSEHLMPMVGMEFATVDEAYCFYNTYALEVGFSVRKNLDRKNKANITTMKCFTCSREGKPRERSPTKYPPKFQPRELRIGCNAHMKINICSKGAYKVTSFDPDHNHATTTPTKTRMLKSHRKISMAEKAMGDLADAAGIRPKQTYELLAKQVGGRRNLTFIPDDYKNYLRTKRERAIALGDAGALLQYFQGRQKEDPSFYYTIQLDNDDQITNIFWADGRSLLDYEYFGDVICFDTTYKTNDYGRPFAIFVGVNHHKQTVIFGAALLYDESAPSFEWLFDALLEATSGKAPKVILTNQDFAMSKAITKVLPDTTHRLCVWHMYQNAAKHLSNVFGATTSFKTDFSHCVYDCEDEEDFVRAWEEMLCKYDLLDNKWLADLFKIRKKWALVYGRQVFCADMKSTQRSESINSVIKRHLDPKERLLDFFNHWERILEDRRYAELEADARASQGNPKVPFSEMLKQASIIYTPSVYKVFEVEYGHFLDCAIQDCGQKENVHEYKVTNGRRERIVRHNILSDNMTCTCLKFEFMGVQCCHVIKTLDFMNIKRLPEKYFLERWHKNVKINRRLSLPNPEVEAEVHITKRFSYLTRAFNAIFSSASHDEEAYRYVLGLAREAIPKVEEIISKASRSGQIDGNQLPRNEAPKVILGVTSKKPTGIRKKKDERGRHRYKSSLETSKKKRKIDKSTETSLHADLGGHGLIYGMHALSQESSIINSHITTSPSNLTGLEK
ncbi:protein FAR1-RELATED SEQUENCE 5-like isoform X2 [Carex rostrata]